MSIPSRAFRLQTIRARLTLSFLALVSATLLVIGTLTYIELSRNLLSSVDAGLAARAALLKATVTGGAPTRLSQSDSVIAPVDEAMAQVRDFSTGRIIDTTSNVSGSPFAVPRQDNEQKLNTKVAGIEGTTRVLAITADAPDGKRQIVVGESLQDRHDALNLVLELLVLGGLLIAAITTAAAWRMVALSLRPVDEIQREVAHADVSRGEPVTIVQPESDRELVNLVSTFNVLLRRIFEVTENEQRFLNYASHELRTPLAIISAELELATRSARNSFELQSSIRKANEEIARLIELTQRLLALSRIAAHEEVDTTEVDLKGLIDDAIGYRHAILEEAECNVRNDTSDTIVVRADPVLLRQALETLLDNLAVHAPGCSASVTGRRTPHGFELEVVDDGGAGSHDEDSSRLDRRDGYGLGLQLVRSVAQAHGGTVEFNRNPDAGTRVMMTLVTP